MKEQKVKRSNTTIGPLNTRRGEQQLRGGGRPERVPRRGRKDSFCLRLCRRLCVSPARSNGQRLGHWGRSPGSPSPPRRSRTDGDPAPRAGGAAAPRGKDTRTGSMTPPSPRLPVDTPKPPRSEAGAGHTPADARVGREGCAGRPPTNPQDSAPGCEAREPACPASPLGFRSSGVRISSLSDHETGGGLIPFRDRPMLADPVLRKLVRTRPPA